MEGVIKVADLLEAASSFLRRRELQGIAPVETALAWTKHKETGACHRPLLQLQFAVTEVCLSLEFVEARGRIVARAWLRAGVGGDVFDPEGELPMPLMFELLKIEKGAIV